MENQTKTKLKFVRPFKTITNKILLSTPAPDDFWIPYVKNDNSLTTDFSHKDYTGLFFRYHPSISEVKKRFNGILANDNQSGLKLVRNIWYQISHERRETFYKKLDFQLKDLEVTYKSSILNRFIGTHDIGTRANKYRDELRLLYLEERESQIKKLQESYSQNPSVISDSAQEILDIFSKIKWNGSPTEFYELCLAFYASKVLDGATHRQIFTLLKFICHYDGEIRNLNGFKKNIKERKTENKATLLDKMQKSLNEYLEEKKEGISKNKKS